MLKERTRMLTDQSVLPPDRDDAATDGGPSATASSSSSSVVVYWMQRDVRTLDNWALLYAQHLAHEYGVPLHVMHVLPPPPPPPTSNDDDGGDDDDDDDGSTGGEAHGPLAHLRMTERHGTFLLGGLEAVHRELALGGVPLHVVRPSSASHEDVATAIEEQALGAMPTPPLAVVCDVSPLRHVRQWTESPHLRGRVLAKGEGGQTPLWQVDAHNVVPVWHASPKREVGARTLRPKLHKLLRDCLQSRDLQPGGRVPAFSGNCHLVAGTAMHAATAKMAGQEFRYDEYRSYLQWDDRVGRVDWAVPGTEAALRRYDEFVRTGLPRYDQLRNDPNQGAEICSSLSPWLNFGHVGFATLLRRLESHNRDAAGKQSFVEEGLVRRELSDNFLWYTPGGYDRLGEGGAAAGWALETLETHASDVREYLYTLPDLETGMTHDDLWNAAQLQVVRTGKLHGFLRMYWAKKILEWTPSPQRALDCAQYLNDYYALDGRDPNGFVGVGWSIMGIHDQGWKERPVFGKIRYMNYKGCQRKFKVDQFVARYPPAAENARRATASAGGGGSTGGSAGGAGSGSGKRRERPTEGGGPGKSKRAKK
jgi:deoxyribodipyrimidine photo-lyase